MFLLIVAASYSSTKKLAYVLMSGNDYGDLPPNENLAMRQK